MGIFGSGKDEKFHRFSPIMMHTFTATRFCFLWVFLGVNMNFTI